MCYSLLMRYLILLAILIYYPLFFIFSKFMGKDHDNSYGFIGSEYIATPGAEINSGMMTPMSGKYGEKMPQQKAANCSVHICEHMLQLYQEEPGQRSYPVSLLHGGKF